MNSLNLKLMSCSNLSPTVYIDGNKMELKKNQLGSYTSNYATDKDEVELKIYTPKHELDNKYWFWWFLLYYFISVFGLFDVGYNKKFYNIEYIGKVKIHEDTNLSLSFLAYKNNEKAIVCKEGEFDDNETNKYLYNDKLPKRRKITNLIRILSWVIIAIVSVVLIVV